MGLIKRFFARIAAEAFINELRIDESGIRKLRAYEKHFDAPDYPWPDREESAEFWKAYERMVGRPRRAY